MVPRNVARCLHSSYVPAGYQVHIQAFLVIIDRPFNQSRVTNVFTETIHYPFSHLTPNRRILFSSFLPETRSSALRLSVFVLYHFLLMNFCNEYPRGRIFQMFAMRVIISNPLYRMVWLTPIVEVCENRNVINSFVYFSECFPTILAAFYLSFVHIFNLNKFNIKTNATISSAQTIWNNHLHKIFLANLFSVKLDYV